MIVGVNNGDCGGLMVLHLYAASADTGPVKNSLKWIKGKARVHAERNQ
jgi:hypothetical protein